MTEYSEGRPTTPEDRLWKAFGDTFTPDKQIAMLDAKAERVVGQITVIATVFGAGGLLAVATILTVPDSRNWALIAVALAGAAALAALITQVRWPKSFHPGNLVELRKWFDRYARWRGWLLAAASLLIVAAFGAALVAAALGLTVNVREPAISLTTLAVPGEKDVPDTVKVTVSGTVPASAPDETATAVLMADGKEVANTLQAVGAGSVITIALEASGLSPDARLQLTVTGSHWICELTGGIGIDPSSECTL